MCPDIGADTRHTLVMGWMDNYRSHTLWDVLDGAKERLEEVQEAGELNEDAERAEMVHAVLARLDGMRHSPDITITQASLDAAVGPVQNLTAHLPNLEPFFSSAYGPQTFDSLVRLVGAWPLPDAAVLASLESDIATVVSGMTKARSRLFTLNEKLTKTDTAIEEYETAQREAAENLVADVMKRVAEVDRNVTTLSTTAETQKGRIDTAIEGIQNDFTANESERGDTWTTHLAAQQTAADAHLKRMAEYEAKSVKVLGSVGVNSTATDFGVYANEQRKAASTWRRIAATVFALAGLWFIGSAPFWPWISDESGWESALARLGVTAAVAGVGAYAARESSQHRREERRAKQVQLVLTALEPFIANLPPEEQKKIRTASAEAIFVLRIEEASNDTGPGDFYQDLVKSLLAKVPGPSN